MERYNFLRTRDGALMAEGVAVHADSVGAAVLKAVATIFDKRESLIYSGKSKCIGPCAICEGKESNES